MDAIGEEEALSEEPPSRIRRRRRSIPWRRVAVQVLLASLLGWIGVGVITLALVAFADRPVGSAFGLALLFVTLIALAAGAASAMLREPPAVGHSFDWVLGREPIHDRATGEEGELGGLTPLGVALAIAVEIGVVLVVTGVS